MIDLWSDVPRKRLEAARQVTSEELAGLQGRLAAGCPVKPWPYGNATSVNPYLITLGASPGNSPSAESSSQVEKGGHDFPTAGVPHSGVYYRDTKGYWDKVRFLAKSTIQGASTDDDEFLSLFGNLNLDPGRSGDAASVRVNVKFAEWLLRVIRYQLRPRYVVMLGLKSWMSENQNIASLVEGFFPGVKLKNPHRQVRFEAYHEKSMLFREWDANIEGNQMTFVMWPQHPSRAPFSNLALWEESCREFARRHGLPIT